MALTLALDGDVAVSIGESECEHTVFDEKRQQIALHVVDAVITVRPLTALLSEEEKRRLLGESGEETDR